MGRNFLKKLKKAINEEKEKVDLQTQEILQALEKEKKDFFQKSDEILKRDLDKIERLKEKMECLSNENDLEELDKTIKEMLAISKEDIGKRVEEEFFRDSLKDVTEKN